MIRIYLGNLGSGKTCNAVKEMIEDRSNRKTYTNIVPMSKSCNWIKIRPEDIITLDINDKGKVKYSLNKDFWMKQPKPLNIVWDEIHLSMGNSRRSMSSPNIVLSQFIALARRFVGSDLKGYGHLIFIAQHPQSVDANIRRLTNEIRYHRMHWIMNCQDCYSREFTNSDKEEIELCSVCRSPNLIRSNFICQVFKFRNWEKYIVWKYFTSYAVHDLSDYFKYYDTEQMEDMWEDYLKEI